MPPKFNSHGTVQIEFVQVYNALGGNEYSQKLTKKYINDKIKKTSLHSPQNGFIRHYVLQKDDCAERYKR